MPNISLNDIEALSRRALISHGASDWIAISVARSVRRAEETGNVICGLYYLESYCLQLDSGRVDGTVEPDVQRVRPGAVLADARFGFAQPAFERGLPVALDAVKENGMVSFAVANSHTCTSVGYFTEQIARAGYVALGCTNASRIVAPPGGAKPVLGTNPIAFSVPDGHGGLAMHSDFSTSAVALGKITMAKAAGESIPEGWAVGPDGQPTTDPATAISGSLMSAAGYKGWGLGLMVEVLASAMTGSVNSLDVVGLKVADGPPHGLGQHYLLLDPGVYSGSFGERVARVGDAVAEQPGARLPGQGRRSIDPVTVDDALWTKLEGLAAR
jgi:(2R)-3-sulfolactate dehydrogenase (NADP+)